MVEPLVIEVDAGMTGQQREIYEDRAAQLEADGSLRPIVVKIKGKLLSSIVASYIVRLMQIARSCDREVALSVECEKCYSILRVLKVTRIVRVMLD